MKRSFLFIITLFISFTVMACTTQENTGNPNVTREEVEITQSILTGEDLSEAGTSYDTTGLNRQEVTQTFLTNPSRVAIFSYDALDILDYVGIEKTSISKLGIVKNNLPSFLESYDDNEYDNVGTLFLPDYDALDLFQPELIVIGGRSTGAYDALHDQYPQANILDVTMTYGEYEEGLTRNAMNLAKIFPSISDDITETLEDIVDDMNSIATTASSYEALFILVNGQALSFYGQTGRFAVLFDEFGFLPADDSVDSGGSHGDLVGYEYVSAVNPEILFLMDRGAAIGNESTLDDVTSNSLIQETNAGQNDHIYSLNGEAWYIASGGFMATEIMIDDMNVFINNLAA